MLVYVPTRNISNKQILQQGDIVMCTSSGSPDVVGRLQPNSPLQTPGKDRTIMVTGELRRRIDALWNFNR